MSNENHHILREHFSKEFSKEEIANIHARKFKTERRQDYFVFEKSETEMHFSLSANYFVGVDWLVKDEHSIQVEPKVNTALINHFSNLTNQDEQNEEVIEKEEKQAEIDAQQEPTVELNYLKMLLEVMSNPKVVKETNDLVKIYWNEPQISISQKQDQLTPFLIVQFLQLLKTIVRKGLKKSYFKKQENLRNRLKGKILVGQHIKQNVFKNRFTQTHCEYQEFGYDTIENRFLKKVWQFCSAYVENNTEIFKDNVAEIKNIIDYVRPPFELIGNDINEYDLKHIKHNPFFTEYKEAITLGKFILKKFAYTLSKTKATIVSTPPFWIDMPRLFELYFYAKLLKANPNDSLNIHFQFSTYGNALDFLISNPDFPMIIDTKYKLQYQWGRVHEDIRQVSGYARLKKVRNELKLENQPNQIINCLIIYPDIENGLSESELTFDKIVGEQQPIQMYHKVYKLGIKLPILAD